ncbi:MAG: hypothetical protein ACXABI_03970 [Candidatus Hodarchaeales archaeon]
MLNNRRYMILVTELFILLVVSSVKTTNIQTAQLEYQGIDFTVNNQYIVDDQVLVTVNSHHPGFIAIYNITDGSKGSILGYSYSRETSISHNHSQGDINSKIQKAENGEDHTAHIRIKISDTGRTSELIAKLYNDTNNNKLFETDGTDGAYKDELGQVVEESFNVLGISPTSITVSNQTINLKDGLVFIDEVIVPGPAWLLIHLNNEGSLGQMAGRMFTPLTQGINSDLNVDISAILTLFDDLESLNVFAHLHWDNKEYGIFNHTSDTHLYSPAFNDPILGNDSAVAFTITIDNGETITGTTFAIFICSLLGICTQRIRRRRLERNS